MRLPTRAVFMITKQDCGAHCNFCLRRRWNKKSLPKPDVMHPVVFKAIMFQNWLPDSVKEICLEGWGEPARTPNFNYYVKELKARGFKVHVTSNGGVFRAESLSLIDTLSINFMAQSTIGLVFWNYCQDLKNRKVPKARFSFTLNKQTMRLLPAAIVSSAVYGFDPLKVNYMKAYTKEMLPHIIVFDEAFAKWKQLMNRFATSKGVEINWPRTRSSGKCTYAWDIIHVEMTGAVMPCIGALEMAGTICQPFEEVWISHKYKAFRENKSEICHKCIYCNSSSASNEETFNQIDDVFAPELNLEIPKEEKKRNEYWRSNLPNMPDMRK